MVVAAYPAALLVLSLCLVFLIATNKTWQYTFGVLLSFVASELRKIPSVGLFGHGIGGSTLAAPFEAVNNYVLRAIGTGITDLEKAVLSVWANMIATVQELGGVLGDLAQETERGLKRLRAATGAAALTAALSPGGYLFRQLLAHLIPLVRAAIHVTVAPVKTIVQRVTKIERKTVEVTKTVYKTATVAAAAGLTTVLPRIKRLEREATSLEKWVKAHARTLTEAGVASVAIAAVAKEWPALSCRNNRNLAKQLCGIPVQRFENILAQLAIGTAAILGTIDLKTLATETQSLVTTLQPEIAHFWRATTGAGSGGDRQPGQAAG